MRRIFYLGACVLFTVAIVTALLGKRAEAQVAAGAAKSIEVTETERVQMQSMLQGSRQSARELHLAGLAFAGIAAGFWLISLLRREGGSQPVPAAGAIVFAVIYFTFV